MIESAISLRDRLYLYRKDALKEIPEDKRIKIAHKIEL